MTPEPEVVLGGRYALIRQVAVGGMGEVWEATDTLLDRAVAVKILKDEFRTASTFLDRFRAEARHAGQLNHRAIATVYDYHETPDLAFLVMELVRGRNLSELMIERPDLPTMTKLSILAQAAEGLRAAHEAGVVHRDVKPGNLMVRDDGTVKVTDFGIARALASAPITENGQMVGTPAYVSPEQATGKPVTGASDIYSLAVVAYELFAGHPPFERDTPLALALAHVNDPPPPLPATVPRRTANLIESALAKDPSLRPPSAALFAREIRLEMASAKAASSRMPPSDQGRGPTPTMVSPSASGPIAGRESTLSSPIAVRRRPTRRSDVVLFACAGLLLLMGSVILAVALPTPVGDAGSDRPVASTATASTVPTATSPATQTPATRPPATDPPTTRPPATEPPTTQPPTTEPPTTEPPTTEPPATEPPTTQPPATQPPATEPPTTEPPATEPAAPSDEGRQVSEGREVSEGGQIGEDEALAFVVDYYGRVDAGDYETTWELLSPGFRDARDLTFDSYVSYWENTTLELGALRFVAGPGEDESRVVFDARYDTGSRVVEETDEITLRRHADGHLVITEQRTV